jgi:hypothetical protein
METALLNPHWLDVVGGVAGASADELVEAPLRCYAANVSPTAFRTVLRPLL